MVDGVDRVFADEKPGVLELARELKHRNGGSKIQIRDRSNGGLSERSTTGGSGDCKRPPTEAALR
jgi:hypothetical protein